MISDVVLAAGQLQVVFQQHADRVAHRVEVRSGDVWQPVLESIEGTASDDWPTSPPLQSIQLEQRESGDVALLVGMAGRSHWSASVAAQLSQNLVVWDIACRIRGESGWIGSSYRWLVSSSDLSRRQFAITPRNCVVQETEESAVFVPARQVTTDSSRTVQWAFSMAVLQ